MSERLPVKILTIPPEAAAAIKAGEGKKHLPTHMAVVLRKHILLVAFGPTMSLTRRQTLMWTSSRLAIRTALR